jgi:hypothetical protein
VRRGGGWYRDYAQAQSIGPWRGKSVQVQSLHLLDLSPPSRSHALHHRRRLTPSLSVNDQNELKPDWLSKPRNFHFVPANSRACKCALRLRPIPSFPLYLFMGSKPFRSVSRCRPPLLARVYLWKHHGLSLCSTATFNSRKSHVLPSLLMVIHQGKRIPDYRTSRPRVPRIILLGYTLLISGVTGLPPTCRWRVDLHFEDQP